MNRLWAAGIIAVMLFVLCVSGLRVTNQYTEDITQSLTELKIVVENDDMETAYQMSNDVLSRWRDDYHHKMCTYISHTRLESIDQILSGLPPLIKYNTKDQFEAECDRAVDQIDHLKDIEMPTLENIL